LKLWQMRNFWEISGSESPLGRGRGDFAYLSPPLKARVLHLHRPRDQNRLCLPLGRERSGGRRDDYFI